MDELKPMEQRNELTTAEIAKSLGEMGDLRCDVAVYRLEQLERENAALRESNGRFAQAVSELTMQAGAAITRAEKAEAERDAAIAEIKESYAFSTREDGKPIYDFALCLVCAKKDKPECDCTSSVGSEFEWRGLRGKESDGNRG